VCHPCTRAGHRARRRGLGHCRRVAAGAEQQLRGALTLHLFPCSSRPSPRGARAAASGIRYPPVALSITWAVHTHEYVNERSDASGTKPLPTFSSTAPFMRLSTQTIQLRSMTSPTSPNAHGSDAPTLVSCARTARKYSRNHFVTKSRRRLSFSVIFGRSDLMSLSNDARNAACR